MKAEEAWQNLDLKNARLIEGIMGGIADVSILQLRISKNTI